MEKNVTGRKRKWQVYLLAGVVFSAGLISPMFPAKTMQVYAAETESVQAETIADGTYTINGVLRHAVQDQDSMGNTAISKPMTLQVSGGNCQLVLDLVPLTIRLGKKDFNGYLAEMLYYPDVDGRVPTESDAASGAEILEQYDGVYDSYNDPENGLDENVKGMIYPKKIAIPVTEGDGEIWTQVYVPVMEAVSAGSGEQYARLQLDWSSLTAVSKPIDCIAVEDEYGSRPRNSREITEIRIHLLKKRTSPAYIPCCYRRPVYPEERMYIQKRVWKH